MSPEVNSRSIGSTERTQDTPAYELIPLRMGESTGHGTGKALVCA